MKHHRVQSEGFTMIELMVTMGLFMVMTGAVLANYRTFDTNAKFSNASEDIVLALRQAQVYGAGVKGQGGSFDVPYGVHFAPNADNIILFADINGDGKYTGADGLPVDTIKWQGNIKINSLTCGGLPCTSFLDITFKRPDIGAIINDSSAVPYLGSVVIITNGAKTSTTTISSAGQISLQ